MGRGVRRTARRIGLLVVLTGALVFLDRMGTVQVATRLAFVWEASTVFVPSDEVPSITLGDGTVVSDRLDRIALTVWVNGIDPVAFADFAETPVIEVAGADIVSCDVASIEAETTRMQAQASEGGCALLWDRLARGAWFAVDLFVRGQGRAVAIRANDRDGRNVFVETTGSVGGIAVYVVLVLAWLVIGTFLAARAFGAMESLAARLDRFRARPGRSGAPMINRGGNACTIVSVLVLGGIFYVGGYLFIGALDRATAVLIYELASGIRYNPEVQTAL